MSSADTDQALYDYCSKDLNLLNDDCRQIASTDNTKRVEFDRLWTDYCMKNSRTPECACFDADTQWFNHPECFSPVCKERGFKTKAMENTNCLTECANIVTGDNTPDNIITDCKGFGVTSISTSTSASTSTSVTSESVTSETISKSVTSESVTVSKSTTNDIWIKIGFSICLIITGLLGYFFGGRHPAPLYLSLFGLFLLIVFLIFYIFKIEGFQVSAEDINETISPYPDNDNGIAEYYIKLGDKYISMCPDCEVASCPNILCLRDDPDDRYSRFYLVPKYNILGLYGIQSAETGLYWRVCQRCIEVCPYSICVDSTLIANPETNFQLLPTSNLNTYYIRANNELFLDVVACPNPCSIDNQNILSSFSKFPNAVFTLEKLAPP